MQYPEFEAFHTERLNKKPYDHSHNPIGFPPEELGKSSDISALMPIISYFGSLVNHATEFGVRFCSSTSALLKTVESKVVGYDLFSNPDIQYLERLSRENNLPCKFQFIQGNTLEVDPIRQTQLLMIDSLHTFSQVQGELQRHAGKVSRYLLFHDTSPWSQGNVSVDRPDQKGILPAIEEFLLTQPLWKRVLQINYNHGLTVLQKDEVC